VSATKRIQFVDALRGVAALAVVLYHYGERIDWHNWGNMGVPIFFVLSGFVIAMSVGAYPPVSASFLGRFTLRRAIRLDPPYWLSIAATIVIGLAAAAVFEVEPKPTTFSQVLTHMFYLQAFAGHDHIMVIYWTLCYEIQFYLTLIPLLWIGNRFGLAMPLMFATMLLSLLDRRFEITGVAFMGRFWFCFVAGALVYWATCGRLKARYLLAGLALIGAFGAVTLDPYAATVTVTAGALFAVIHFGLIELGSNGPLQFLGRISYSLYLTHLIGGWLVLTFALKFMPPWPAMILGVIASLVSAWIFYLVVERPAIRLSKIVKLPSGMSAARVPAAAVPRAESN
jgi:peptidoglycan/LPS O-acetylase OafA/YrhL